MDATVPIELIRPRRLLPYLGEPTTQLLFILHFLQLAPGNGVPESPSDLRRAPEVVARSFNISVFHVLVS
jgi:hypothetical protein